MSVEARIEAEHHHVALRVRDLEAMVAFYTEVVGLRPRKSAGDPARPTVVWFSGLQLIRAEGEELSGRGAFDHLAIGVSNIVPLFASLQAHGVAIEEGGIRDMSLGGKPLRAVFFRDPEGNRVELVDYSQPG